MLSWTKGNRQKRPSKRLQEHVEGMKTEMESGALRVPLSDCLLSPPPSLFFSLSLSHSGQGAVIGIDDEDDSTFTITVDQKTFHFQGEM